MGRTPVVLVVTGQDDHSPDLIIPALHERGADVVRLDPTATPLRLDCHLAGVRWRGTLSAGDGRTVDLDRVTSVLYRWPPAPPGNPAIGDERERRWAAIEDTQALAGLLKTLDAAWMNFPDRVIAAGSKPVQLRDAAECGLAVPGTLVATSGHAARRWAPTVGGAILAKTFRAEHQGTLALAHRVGPSDLPEELLSAVIFQRVVEGTPLRVIVVGEEIFAGAIAGDYDLDWRSAQETLTMAPVETPAPVESAIKSLMGRWGLSYGAFDFIDDGRRWWFLECNPAGQFGLTEARTGLPITAAIATWLTTPRGR